MAEKKKLVLAWCYSATVDGPFASSVAETFLYDANSRSNRLSGKGAGFIALQTSPRMAEARNQIVRTFLQNDEFSKAEWLMMLDSDMSWKYNDIHHLVDVAEVQGYRLAGGLCFGAADMGKDVFPTIYVNSGHSTEGYPLLDRVYDYPRNMLVEADATGAAFLLMHRQLLKDMYMTYGKTKAGRPAPYPWFEDGVWGDRPYGEDIGFCLKARAMGTKLMIHTGIKVNHLKVYPQNEESYDRLRGQQHGDSGPGGDPAVALAAAGGEA